MSQSAIPNHLIVPLGERLHELQLPLLDWEAFDLIAQGRVVVVFDLGKYRREINIVSPETTVQDLAHEISKREPFE